MKNLLFVIMLGTTLFSDCSNKYDITSYYSIRGQEHYLQYMECSKTEDFGSGD